MSSVPASVAYWTYTRQFTSSGRLHGSTAEDQSSFCASGGHHVQGFLPVVGPQMPAQPVSHLSCALDLGIYVCLGVHTVREAEDLTWATDMSLLLEYWVSTSPLQSSVPGCVTSQPLPQGNRGCTGEGLMEDKDCCLRRGDSRTCLSRTAAETLLKLSPVLKAQPVFSPAFTAQPPGESVKAQYWLAVLKPWRFICTSSF